MIVAIFDQQVTPILPNFESMGLSIQERKFNDFQDGYCGGHLVFPIGTSLAIFDLQVTLVILTKFQVNWLSSGEEAKMIFKMAAILCFRSERF